MIGWEARRFHFMPAPKGLGYYLEPAPSPEVKRVQGGRAVLDMFKRIHNQGKKGTDDGSR